MRVSLLAVTLAGVLTSLTASASGVCVIVGSVAYERFAAAQKLAAKATALGFPKAAIYDTRDVPEFAWGQLAVVADVVADNAAAAPVVSTLKKGKLSAFAKPCTLPATAITSASDLLAEADGPPEPYELDIEVLEPGCHAWSPVLKAAFCVVGKESWQDVEWKATFPGAEIADFPLQTVRVDAEEAKLDPESAGAKALAKVLEAGKFQEIPEGRTMDAANWLSWAEHRFTVRASKRLEVAAGENQAPRYGYSFTFRCGKQPMAPAGIVNDLTDEAPRIEVRKFKNTPLVIIEVHYNVADEGEYGSGVDVVELILPPACVAP